MSTTPSTAPVDRSVVQPARERRGPARAAAWLAPVVLVAAVAVVYGRALDFELLEWDDRLHTVENPHLMPPSWQGVGTVWREPYFGLYIPVAYTFFAVEMWLAGAANSTSGGAGAALAGVLHAGSLLLHAACGLAVWQLLRRLVRHEAAALGGALLFVVHPLQVESVAWLSETRGLLATLFSIGAVAAYLKASHLTLGRAASFETGTAADDTPQIPTAASAGGISRASQRGHVARRPDTGDRKVRRTAAVAPAVGWLILASIAYLLALLSKPSAVAVPLVAVVFDLCLISHRWRWTWVAPVLWLLPAVAITWLTRGQQTELAQLPNPNVFERLLVAGDALAFYAWKLLVPLGLTTDYGRRPDYVLAQWWPYAAWLVPVAIVALAAWLPGRQWWLAAVGVWIAALAPVLGLAAFGYQEMSTVADRYMYFAMLGPALALAVALSRVDRWPAFAAAAVWLALLGGVAWQATGYWRNDRVLFARALEVNPRSFTAVAIEARQLATNGQTDEAIAAYRAALELRPDFARARANLGQLLLAQGNAQEAVVELRRAVALRPGDPQARSNLGEALVELGELEAALVEHEQAARRAPHDALIQSSWGDALVAQGDWSAAVARFEEAVRLRPDLVVLHFKLGDALAGAGRYEEAQVALEAVLEREPDFPPAHFGLGNLLAMKGQLEAAAAQFELARSEFYQAEVRLGEVRRRQGRPAEAVEAYRRAIDRRPDDLDARTGLGRALLELGDTRAGIVELRRVVRQRPTWLPAAVSLAWTLATLPEDEYRSAAEAERVLRGVLRGARPDDPYLLDLQAAIHAEARRFDQAVGDAERAAELARQRGLDALAERIEERLARYRRGEAYREDPRAVPAGLAVP